MEPMSERAFISATIIKAARYDILNTIRDYEKRHLPQGRYLTGSELSHYLWRIGAKNHQNKIELTNPTMEDAERMDVLWKKYEWLEEKIFEKRRDGKDKSLPLSSAEEIHRWEDWAFGELGGLRPVEPMPTPQENMKHRADLD